MLEDFLIALALAMDCFAVSVASGVIVGRRDLRISLSLAVLFGLFQAAMPLLGWALTARFSHYLEAVDHWIAFGLLAFIGAKMIFDSFKEEDQSHSSTLHPSKPGARVVLAIATSIDALAVGISYACTGSEHLTQLAQPLVLIGIVSFLMSTLGFYLGRRFGQVVTRRFRPELLGGLILIAIGIKILLEHLLG
ncbi:MAG: manganese efflux pump [Bacteroidales bacterium]|nr:manganese efflux pump [Bacteroidales bacterium]